MARHLMDPPALGDDHSSSIAPPPQGPNQPEPDPGSPEITPSEPPPYAPDERAPDEQAPAGQTPGEFSGAAEPWAAPSNASATSR